MTATIESVTPQCTDGTTINLLVRVLFEDKANGFSVTKIYSLPSDTTQESALATITEDANTFKSTLESIGNLKQQVGSVITI